MTRHALVNVTTDGQMGSRAVRQLWIAAVSPPCACRERPFRASSPRVILSCFFASGVRGNMAEFDTGATVKPGQGRSGCRSVAQYLAVTGAPAQPKR